MRTFLDWHLFRLDGSESQPGYLILFQRVSSVPLILILKRSGPERKLRWMRSNDMILIQETVNKLLMSLNLHSYISGR
jgi:hypothetical protein